MRQKRLPSILDSIKILLLYGELGKVTQAFLYLYLLYNIFNPPYSVPVLSDVCAERRESSDNGGDAEK
jgi:hypothetical protein